MFLEQVLALGELGGAPVDRRRHVQELGGELVDLVVQVDEVLLDLGDLLLDLDEQAADVVVLGGDGGELGASQVECVAELVGAVLEVRQLGSLALEGSRQRLLRCLRVGELRAGLLEFCLWISGKGRAAWLSCDDVPSDRHQGHEGDDKM